MKERPIIFSGPMVKAILDGHKTQTRRVVNLKIGGGKLNAKAIGFTQSNQEPLCWYGHVACGGPTDGFIDEFLCPFGKPGDRLWVRETWRSHYHETPYSHGIVYRADATKALGAGSHSDAYKWKPSIHMPRKYCRLLLDVTAVRVERLQDIIEDAAIAEGVDAVSLEDAPRQATWSHRQDFAQLWNSLNDKRGYGWDTNPWVWVLTFVQTGLES